VDHPQFTVWRTSLYGVLLGGGADSGAEKPSRASVITAPRSIAPANELVRILEGVKDALGSHRPLNAGHTTGEAYLMAPFVSKLLCHKKVAPEFTADRQPIPESVKCPKPPQPYTYSAAAFRPEVSGRTSGASPHVGHQYICATAA
jgi:hypothetical protein